MLRWIGPKTADLRILLSILGLLIQLGAAQVVPASPPIADPSDVRFKDVTEDWTTPSLTTSKLKDVPPVVGYIDNEGAYEVELIQLQWRFGDPIDLYVMKPTGIKNPPVILYLYGYPADTERFKNRIFQNTVTKDGFAAVGFVSALTGHRYHDRPMKEWFLSELQESLATSAHDVQMILTYLVSRGDLDTSRIGMFAQGSGASIAILASAVDSRIRALDLLDPWGDWPTWLAKSPFVPEAERQQFLKPEFLAQAQSMEPLQWLPKVRAQEVRLQDATFDRITPAASKARIRAALKPDATLKIYETPDQFNSMIKSGKDLQWIQDELTHIPGPQQPGQSNPSDYGHLR